MSACRTIRWPARWALVTMGFVGCSLQDFGHLQQGTSAAGGSSAGSSAGGNVGMGGSNAGAAGDSGASTGGGGSASGGSVGGSGTGGVSTATQNSATTQTSHSAGGSSTSTTSSETSTTGSGDGGEAGSPPTGDGNVLVNPSFERDWIGWLVDPAASQGNHARVKWTQPGSTTPDGEAQQNLLGTWHGTDTYVVQIYQSLSGLEDGLYTFKGFFNWGGLHNAVQLFARNCGGDDLIQDIPPTGETQWLEVGIGGIEVVGGNCEVGFLVDSNPADWLNADVFSFEMDPQ